MGSGKLSEVRRKKEMYRSRHKSGHQFTSKAMRRVCFDTCGLVHRDSCFGPGCHKVIKRALLIWLEVECGGVTAS